jgi:putative oxidoreductase
MKKILDWKGHKYLAIPARIYIGWIFIAASLHKIAHPADFALDIATYEILPLFLINIMALTLPWIEIASGVLIIVGFKSRACAWMICGMMIMFIIALGIALYHGLDMQCGCFASSAMEEGDEISYKTMLRDAWWLLVGAYILIFDTTPLGIETLLQKKKEAANA